jgi:hypothetical protein
MKIDDEIERLLRVMESVDGTGSEAKRPVTFWLPVSYKDDYDSIQRKSGRKFSNILIELIKLAIERANKKGGL